MCRACSTQRAVRNIIPRRGYAWARVTCGNAHCHKVMPANLWHCPCHTPWRSCTTHAVWPTHAQTVLQLAECPVPEPKRELSTAPPPVLQAKRARLSAPAASAFTASLPVAAESSSNCPRKRFAASEDQPDVTQRLLAKMPKLSAKFAHLATKQTGIEEGCRDKFTP